MTATGNGSRSERPRRTRSVTLLERVLGDGRLDHDHLAQALVVSRAELDAYLAETTPIPLERQLVLAMLVIEQVPDLVRMGHQLRAQVAAAMAFEQRAGESPEQRVSRF